MTDIKRFQAPIQNDGLDHYLYFGRKIVSSEQVELKSTNKTANRTSSVRFYPRSNVEPLILTIARIASFIFIIPLVLKLAVDFINERAWKQYKNSQDYKVIKELWEEVIVVTNNHVYDKSNPLLEPLIKLGYAPKDLGFEKFLARDKGLFHLVCSVESTVFTDSEDKLVDKVKGKDILIINYGPHIEFNPKISDEASTQIFINNASGEKSHEQNFLLINNATITFLNKDGDPEDILNHKPQFEAIRKDRIKYLNENKSN